MQSVHSFTAFFAKSVTAVLPNSRQLKSSKLYVHCLTCEFVVIGVTRSGVALVGLWATILWQAVRLSIPSLTTSLEVLLPMLTWTQFRTATVVTGMAMSSSLKNSCSHNATTQARYMFTCPLISCTRYRVLVHGLYCICKCQGSVVIMVVIEVLCMLESCVVHE